MEIQSTFGTGLEEVYFENRYVSVCGLLNKRTSTLRVIDFRAGPHPDKRKWILDLVRERNLKRVYSLVEREEVSCWIRLGFNREGSVPAFYKRSDAYVMGGVVDHSRPDLGLTPNPTGRAPDYGRAISEGEASRLYQQARRLAKTRSTEEWAEVRVQTARPAQASRALTSARESGRALTDFDRFGRDVERFSMVCTGKGGFSLLASVESQSCYSNAFLELLTAPRTENEALLTSSAIRSLCVELEGKGMVSCFALSPRDNVDLSAAFLANGYRRTGYLRNHLVSGEERSDAFLWARKLAALDSPALMDANADAA